MEFKFCVLIVLAVVHGRAIADESAPASFSLAGDDIVSRPSGDVSEITISGNALLTCDLDADGRMHIKADRLVVKVPTTKPDAPTVREFVADSNCQLTADGIKIKSTRMVATRNLDCMSLRIKLSGDIAIKSDNAHVSATAAILTYSRGKWKVEHLKLKRMQIGG